MKAVKNTEPAGFLALDGMRGIGAMIVVITHCQIFWAGLTTPSGPPIVDIFFLLSGFVIAFAYEPRFRAGMTAGKFMLQRLVRLYPLYLLGLALGLVVRVAAMMNEGGTGGGELIGQLVPALFMLPSPDFDKSGVAYALNAPAWTLFFEMLINVVYIGLWRWLKSTRVLGCFVAASGLWLVGTVLAAGNVDLGSRWDFFWGGAPRVAFSFFTGVFLFRILGAPKSARTRISLWAFAPALLLPFIVLIPSSEEVRPWLDIFIVIAVSPALVCWAQRMNPPRWLWRTSAILGGMSYAMYIVHFPIYDALRRLSYKVPELRYDWGPWSGMVILAVIFGIAVAAERLYDEPVRAWLNAQIKQRSTRKPAVETPPMPANTVSPEVARASFVTRTGS